MTRIIPTWTRPLIFTAVWMGTGYGALQLRPYPWAVVSFLGMVGLPFFAHLEAQRQSVPAGTVSTEPVSRFRKPLALVHASDDATGYDLTAEQISIAKADGRYLYTVTRRGNKNLIYFPHGVTRSVLGEFHSLTFNKKPFNKATQEKLCGTGLPFHNNDGDLKPGLKPPLPAFLIWLRQQEERLQAEWFINDKDAVFKPEAGRTFNAFAQE